MKTRLLLLGLVSSLAFGLPAFAQGGGKSDKGDKKGAPAKSEADAAVDDFYKIRNAQAKQDQAQFQKVIMAGIGFLEKYPAHARALDVVNDLGNYASQKLPIKDKALAPLRGVYVSQLQYETTNARYKESLPEEAKAAIAALTASAADAEARDNTNKQTIETLREKIDALAQVPGSARFLAARERSYFQVLAYMSAARGEAHLKSLLEHPTKQVADMAKGELALLEIKGKPIEAKFTALDGKEIDLTQMRGKLVAVYFWSTTNANSTRAFDQLKIVANDWKKRGLEVVTVSFDKAEDKAKVEKYVHDNKLPFPVAFDGKGNRSDFASRLQVNTGRMVAFDPKGTLIGDANGHSFQVAQLDAIAKIALDPKKK